MSSLSHDKKDIAAAVLSRLAVKGTQRRPLSAMKEGTSKKCYNCQYCQDNDNVDNFWADCNKNEGENDNDCDHNRYLL